ncbi:hypothetical protein QBC46DRAFT_344262 [Diplogelasinospora grovesii]|uniref:Uncharacterized protein n=1 Tax=Diplogelasinospora grovesii TaxID=303347 RepID=A0AAN6N4P5_9PEZI|nr:hypothetical protein QBC46DRAFT_344262 [Diplogelasinospora grovesii]
MPNPFRRLQQQAGNLLPGMGGLSGLVTQAGASANELLSTAGPRARLANCIFDSLEGAGRLAKVAAIKANRAIDAVSSAMRPSIDSDEWENIDDVFPSESELAEDALEEQTKALNSSEELAWARDKEDALVAKYGWYKSELRGLSSDRAKNLQREQILQRQIQDTQKQLRILRKHITRLEVHKPPNASKSTASSQRRTSKITAAQVFKNPEIPTSDCDPSAPQHALSTVQSKRKILSEEAKPTSHSSAFQPAPVEGQPRKGTTSKPFAARLQVTRFRPSNNEATDESSDEVERESSEGDPSDSSIEVRKYCQPGF